VAGELGFQAALEQGWEAVTNTPRLVIITRILFVINLPILAFLCLAPSPLEIMKYTSFNMESLLYFGLHSFGVIVLLLLMVGSKHYLDLRIGAIIQLILVIIAFCGFLSLH
jgi:hypothetical protein